MSQEILRSLVAEKVLRIVEESPEPLTMREILCLSKLGRRSVYVALKILQQQGAVKSKDSLKDTRQKLFWAVRA